MTEEILQLLEVETPAKVWLSNLPLFPCPECGKKTIFEEGCTACTTGDDE